MIALAAVLLAPVYGCSIEGHRDGYFAELVEYGSSLDCAIVVVSVLFGASDVSLPTLTSRRATNRRCNVAVVDSDFSSDDTSASVMSAWTIVSTRAPFAFGPRDSRIPKILAHLFFPRAQYLVYLDSYLRVLQEPEDMVVRYFSNASTLLLVQRHWGRTTFHEELSGIANYDYKPVLEYQRWTYARDNISLDGLAHGSFRMQRAHRLTSTFACTWFNHFMQHSQRDQLSFVRAVNELDLQSRTTYVTLGELSSRVYYSHRPAYTKLQLTTSASCMMRHKLHCTQPRHWFYDIGAGAGQSIRYFSRRTDAFQAWHVVATEPNASVHDALTTTFSATGLLHAKLLLRPLNAASLSEHVAAHVSDVDFVVLKIGADRASWLNRFVDDGTIHLVDVVAIQTRDHALDDALSQKLTALGVPLMSRWNAQTESGFEVSVYNAAVFRWKTLLALRKYKA